MDQGAADRLHCRIYLVGGSRLTVRAGSITTSQAEVIVSSDDDDLSMGGGVSRAIGMDGSWLDIRDEVARALTSRQPLVGEVVVTAAPGLDARFIFHAVTISYRYGHAQADLIQDAVVRQLVARSLDLAARLGCSSIAFPLLATGVAGLGVHEAVVQMIEGIVSNLVTAPQHLEVEVYLFQEDFWHVDRPILEVFEEAISTRDAYAIEREGDAVRLSWWEPPTGPVDDGELPAEIIRATSETRRLQAIFRSLQALDRWRTRLETEHIALCVDEPLGNIARIRQLGGQLARLRGRRGLLERAVASTAPIVRARAVFVSSTYKDLVPYRAGAREAITALNLQFIGMEDFPAGAVAASTVMLDHLTKAQVCVLIIGWRYGTRDPDTGLSYTQFEYENANALGFPVHVFMASDTMPVLPCVLDDDDGGMRVRAFRDEVASRHHVSWFSDADGLHQLILKELADYARA